MNTGNTVPTNTATPYRASIAPPGNTSTPFNANLVPPSNTATPFNATSVATKQPTTPLITAVNPNADAILKAHSQTMSALNKPAPQQNASFSPTAPVNTSGFNAAQLDAFNKAANLGSGVQTTTEGFVGGSHPANTYAQPAGTSAPAPTAPAPQPTQPAVTPGTLGTGSPSQIGANQTAKGMLGSDIAQSQENYKRAVDNFLPLVQQNQQTINQATQEIEQLTAGSYAGTAADYSGRIAQLENLKQLAQTNINNAQANIQAAYNSTQGAFSTGIGAATQYQAAPYGTPQFNPLTGTYTMAGGTPGAAGATGGVGLTYNPQTDAQNFAKAVIGGQLTYQQALNSLGYAGNISTGLLNTAIEAAGGSPLKLEAQGAAQQSNIRTGATTPTSTAAAGYQSAVQNYNSANAQYQTVTNQSKTLQDTMASTGVNDVNSQYYNTAVNQLANQFGSAKYSSFLAALTETQQAYESLLGAVGAATPTLNGVAATSLLTPASTPAQISAAISQLQQAAYNKLQPMYNLISTYQSQLGGSNTSQNAPASSSNPPGWF